MNKAEYLRSKMAEAAPKKPHCFHQSDCAVLIQAMGNLVNMLEADPNVVVLDEEERKHLNWVIDEVLRNKPDCHLCKSIKEKLG